ncbi:peptide ABC transporter substrate-binding protein [Brevibacillus ginsengisoli]|uniref:peptide ABC transporter substrate-binding protein n=1 Tax=Brevibacillus ginsengisoli TaxID=363854 RepID=UPI003CF36268
MKINRSFAITLILISLLVVSCVIGLLKNQPADQGGNSNTHEVNSLSLSLQHDPITLDPSLVEDTTSGSLVRALFDGLTRRGLDGLPHEAVAKSIAISRDNLTYTFTLRDSKWSNGDPVTAGDFEYAWKRVIDPNSASNYAYQMFCIRNAELAHKGLVKMESVGIHALNDHILQVQLAYPTPYFLELTSLFTYYPVHPSTKSNPEWGLDVSSHISNGPFKLKEWKQQHQLTLEKNPYYWDQQTVKLQELHFSLNNSPQTEMSMFERGELDWAGAPLGELPLESLNRLKSSGKLLTYPIAGTYWYKFNVDQPPFQNAKIRKAFAYAINRQAICTDLAVGKTPAMGVVPPSMSLQPAGYFHDHDVTLAKQLLKEGMKELGISTLPPITLSYNTSDTHKKIAVAIQKQWKDNLGVTVLLRDEDWPTYVANLHEGHFQIGRMGWLADYHDPMNFLELFKEQTLVNNDTHWENPEFKQLLNQSSRERNPLKRKELLARSESILMDEMPVLPIFFYTNSYVKNERIQNVLLDGLGYIDWKWANIAN